MLIAGNETEGIGLGTAQFAFRDRHPGPFGQPAGTPPPASTT